MKTRLLSVTVVLVVAMAAIAPAAHAQVPYVTSEYTYDDYDGTTIYYYRVECRSYNSMVVGFDVYAPIDPSLVNPRAWGSWTGSVSSDGSGGSHVSWEVPWDQGLFYGDWCRVSFVILVPVQTVGDYVRPGKSTNWGYDTTSSGLELDGIGSVVVPTLVPEPASFAVLALGCVGLLRRKR